MNEDVGIGNKLTSDDKYFFNVRAYLSNLAFELWSEPRQGNACQFLCCLRACRRLIEVYSSVYGTC